MIKKGLILMFITTFMFTLIGCGSNFNAIMYSDTKTWFKDDFLMENLTVGSHYIIDDEVMVADETNPKFVKYILRTNEEFNSKFNKFPPMINFEDEMLLIYIFTTTFSGPYNISEISLNNKILNIDFRAEKSKSFGDNLSSPQQKCLVVKLDKMEITDANFLAK